MLLTRPPHPLLSNSPVGSRPAVKQDDRFHLPRTGRIVFPTSLKRALFQSQRGRCYYCGKTHRIHYLEIDHKWPVSRGGGNEIDNLQLLCVPCNMRKGIQTDAEFRDRYRRLMPPSGGIPYPAIDQEDFTDETQRTRAAREVRSIYHQRFSSYRRSRSGCGSLIAIGLAAAIVVLLWGLGSLSA